MPYISAVNWSRHGQRVAQVWMLDGPKVAEVTMPPGATLDETWGQAVQLYEAIVQAEFARDHRATIESVIAASYPA